MPASYVKPYVKRGKTDAADAEAICEAVTRPTMSALVTCASAMVGKSRQSRTAHADDRAAFIFRSFLGVRIPDTTDCITVCKRLQSLT